MTRRMYTSGSRWAVWRWTFTPSGYLTRLFLVHTPWGGVMLHWINGPDPEPDMHNHPVTFLSLILRGAYCELRPIPGTCSACEHMEVEHVGYWHSWWNFIRAGEDVHRIKWVARGTLTLVFYGPKRCNWGFYTAQGFVPWKEYNAKYRATNT
jgi:hypothetical protein